MPEGDSLRRAAERLSVLAGEVVAAESPHPRAAALGIAARVDGRRLERVEAVGKNLLLSFEDGLVVRSHLRMRGRWHLRRAGAGAPGSGAGGPGTAGKPWLVLRGERYEAVLWHGPVLELGRAGVEHLGPDILAEPLDVDRMVDRIRRLAGDTAIGEALLDQRAVAGIGNMWRAEALFSAGVSPWRLVRELDDETLARVLEAASTLMRGRRSERLVYRRAGLPCRRCRAPIRSRRQGDGARTAYWCPSCQAGSEAAKA